MENKVSPIISAINLRPFIDKRDVVIVDVRGGADAMTRYLAGHLEGAIPVNLDSDLSDIGDPARGGRHPLPDPSRFGLFLGQIGIDPATHVLVYDDKAGANAAARFWWMMRAAGHSNIQVIDGGLDALQEAGLPLATGAAPAPKAVALPYPVSNWSLPLANMELISDMRTNEHALVIDVRESFRYRGESEPIDLVAGHIPGAINVPYVDNLEPHGKFRSSRELAKMYWEIVGNRHPLQIAVHCGSGVTACHTLLAMEIAGLPIPRLYVGSWSEWSRNKQPVATGSSADAV